MHKLVDSAQRRSAGRAQSDIGGRRWHAARPRTSDTWRTGSTAAAYSESQFKRYVRTVQVLVGTSG